LAIDGIGGGAGGVTGGALAIDGIRVRFPAAPRSGGTSGGSGVPSAPTQSPRSRPCTLGFSVGGTITVTSSRSMHSSRLLPASVADRNRTSVAPPSWRSDSTVPRTATSPVAVMSTIENVRPHAIVAGNRSAPRSMPPPTTAINDPAVANRVLTITSIDSSRI
jgi:hypothetical protein